VLLLSLNFKKSLLFNYLETRKTCGKSLSDIKYVLFFSTNLSSNIPRFYKYIAMSRRNVCSFSCKVSVIYT
jgi:hypothetical protein